MSLIRDKIILQLQLTTPGKVSRLCAVACIFARGCNSADAVVLSGNIELREIARIGQQANAAFFRPSIFLLAGLIRNFKTQIEERLQRFWRRSLFCIKKTTSSVPVLETYFASTTEMMISFSASLRSSAPPSAMLTRSSYSVPSDRVSTAAPVSSVIDHSSLPTSASFPSAP